jgi:hypothetical protein
VFWLSFFANLRGVVDFVKRDALFTLLVSSFRKDYSDGAYFVQCQKEFEMVHCSILDIFVDKYMGLVEEWLGTDGGLWYSRHVDEKRLTH